MLLCDIHTHTRYGTPAPTALYISQYTTNNNFLKIEKGLVIQLRGGVLALHAQGPRLHPKYQSKSG